ncbi:MAG: acyl carrier protein [Flavobacteriaceae bacterium]|nr:acyl carrier protein [Flavobacteriaceae bacterium]MCB0474304.1 acyl carrier protein [Flavobacteriaceae bacterium]
MKSEIKKYIIEASMTDSKNIDDNTQIFETGLLDSMGLLFLIEFLKEKYNVEVNDEELNPKNFESINSIVAFVNSKIQVEN